MIEFSGEISKSIKTKTLKKRNRQLGFLFLAISLVSIIVTIILGVLKNSAFIEILILTIILILLTIYLLISPIYERNNRFKWEYTIKIDNNNIIINSEQSQTQIKKPITKVKKVIDAQDCYYLIYADISNAYICQKSLLTKGTLEEFEELFKGKIKRIKK